ncbi:hypothetical protein [Evansella halocellulosilytica]|uniref:hypothetical protein n=1 Tax=Evansella halocellulosilytica TaxID=2011013 RepID=UPI000BB8DAF8|nr:hypothetical protein [Evansella halocellulosilytica]
MSRNSLFTKLNRGYSSTLKEELSSKKAEPIQESAFSSVKHTVRPDINKESERKNNKLSNMTETNDYEHLTNSIHMSEEGHWDRKTERLMRQVSMRYADEVLNALTPISGMLQLIEGQPYFHSYEELIEQSKKGIMKSKGYIQDFLSLNHPKISNKDRCTLDELLTYVKESLEQENPEISPFINWKASGSENTSAKILVDKNKVRMFTQLLIKKWVDFLQEANSMYVTFYYNHEMSVMVEIRSLEDESLSAILDDEFHFYCHLVQRNLNKIGGELVIGKSLQLYF